MTTQALKHPPVKPLQVFGIPVWSAAAIFLAALITGALIATLTGHLGRGFIVCFVVGAITATAIVKPKGLFLIVSLIPIAFGFVTSFTGWYIGRQTAPDGSSALSKTALLPAALPLAKYFPVLLCTVLVVIAVAIFRTIFVRKAWIAWRAARRAVAEARRGDLSERERAQRATLTRTTPSSRRRPRTSVSSQTASAACPPPRTDTDPMGQPRSRRALEDNPNKISAADLFRRRQAQERPTPAVKKDRGAHTYARKNRHAADASAGQANRTTTDALFNKSQREEELRERTTWRTPASGRTPERHTTKKNTEERTDTGKGRRTGHTWLDDNLYD